MTMGPTKEFVAKTLRLPQEFLDDCALFLDEGRFRSSVDRAYYSIHFGAVALLVSLGVEAPRSHRGLVNLFGREIVKTGVLGEEYGDIVSYALRERTISTYDAVAEISEAETEEVVNKARRFHAAIRSLLDM